MTRTRLEILQWYALFGGALAWTSQHVGGFFVSTANCSAAPLNATLWQILIGAVAGVLVVAAEASAFLVYLRTRDVDKDAPGPYGRLHFFAQAALLGNVLFLVIIVLDTVDTVYQLPCGS